jgi:hypothetical protein
MLNETTGAPDQAPTLLRKIRNLLADPYLGQYAVTFLRQHMFYLLWIFLVPIVLYSMAQGRELFTGLFDDSSFFTAIRAMSLLLVYFLLSLVVIMIPRPFYRRKTLQEWKLLRPVSLKDPGLQYILGVLPTLLFGVVMIIVQRDRIEWWGFILIALTLAATFGLAYRFEHRWRWSVKITLMMIGVNMLFCLLILWLFAWTFKNINPFLNYFIVGGCLMVQLALTAGLSKQLHAAMMAVLDRPTPTMSEYDWLYSAVTVFLTGFVALCLSASNLESISPVFLLLMITTFYLLMSSLVSAFYYYTIRGKNSKKWYQWVFFGVLGGVLIMVIGGLGAPIHNIRTISDTAPPDRRISFNDWFEGWYKTNLSQDTSGSSEIPIFLVAVQGGGSRAGLWASTMLNQLEMLGNYRFRKHCFAITAASGGASGVGATLAFWRYAADSALVNGDPQRRDSLFRRYPAGVYQRNYLSGSIFDLMFTEIGSRFMFFKRKHHNRNYRLQADEARGFAIGLRRGLDDESAGLGERIGMLWQRGTGTTLRVKRGWHVHNYPMDPYLDYWYQAGKATPRFDLPLYFPITTNIHTGQSGYASPVKAEPRLFVDAVDILDAVKRSDSTATLTMTGATNLSQLFPLMSAFTYIPGSGNYLDGGVFENMGLTLQLAICKRLDSLLQTAPYCQANRKRLKIHMIYIFNNALEMMSSNAYEHKIRRKWQPTALTSFLSTASIEGTSTYFTKQFAYQTESTVSLHKLWLQEPATPWKVPLGRWLARRTVRIADQRAQALGPEIERIVAPLR